MVLAPSGKVDTSSSVNEPLRRASVVVMLARMSVSAAGGAGVGETVGVGAALTGSSVTGTGTTSPV